MKNALILHGTEDNSKKHWFPWLKQELENLGYDVWVPDLPNAEKPNIEKYWKHVKNFNFNEESILIGHSSGAVAILGFLERLPKNVKVKTSYLVGSFKDNLDWDALDELFIKPFDFGKIKNSCEKFAFVHSDDDPYCPLEHAEYLSQKVNGELIILKAQKHFSIGTAGEKYIRFDKLLDLIKIK